ncbi:MAG: hypothetical protein ACI8XM_002727, partial [Haloarculaceae archaeon]
RVAARGVSEANEQDRLDEFEPWRRRFLL